MCVKLALLKPYITQMSEQPTIFAQISSSACNKFWLIKIHVLKHRHRYGAIKPESIFTMIMGMTVTMLHKSNHNKSKEVPSGD